MLSTYALSSVDKRSSIKHTAASYLQSVEEKVKQLMTALAYIALLTGSYAYAASPLSPFVGHWKGRAVGKVADGKQEALTCIADNSLQSSDALRMVLRCANSSGASAHVRATVHTSGHTLSGTWEERVYNVSGNISGTVNGSTLTARIDSPNYAATIRIVRTGNNLSVSVTPSKGTGSFVATLGN